MGAVWTFAARECAPLSPDPRRDGAQRGSLALLVGVSTAQSVTRIPGPAAEVELAHGLGTSEDAGEDDEES